MTAKLYAHPFSSYCCKALVAFYDSGAPFEMQLLSEANPEAGARMHALWPLDHFPVLEVDGRVLAESSVIAEWADLHRTAPGRLIPTDADAALEVRMMDRVFDGFVMSPMQAVVFNAIRPPDDRDPYGVDKALEKLDRSYAWLDQRLAGRTWAAGGEFSLADCSAFASLFYADWVRPLGAHPNLAAYLGRLRERPSVKRCVDEARPYRHVFPLGIPEHAD